MLAAAHPWLRSSAALRELRREVACAAQSDMPILITGDDADDNLAVAEAIHRRSRRAGAPFIAVDCAGASDAALEAALFGCAGADGIVRAACGCFERAHCGTVFIANIDAMSARLQAQLLRFLEDGDIRRAGELPVHRRVDVRVMTSGDGRLFMQALPRRSSLGANERGLAHTRFSEDLLYRLNVMHLVIQPSYRLHDIISSQGTETGLDAPAPANANAVVH
jgi:DNA-binding NtrC family response regulator